MTSWFMLDEIREQPRVLARTASAFRAAAAEAPWTWKREGTLFLVGCGDMAFAAEGAAWFAREKGGPVRPLLSMDVRFLRPRPGVDDLLVAASISGRTPRTVEAARLTASRGAAAWGITSCRNTPLCTAVERFFLLPTGPEEELCRHVYAGYHHNVPQTKSFAAAFFAELLLLRALHRLDPGAVRDLDEVPSHLEEVLPALESSMEAVREKLPGHVERAALLGSGPWKPLAAYGAAKLLEAAVPARNRCLEENNHLDLFVTPPAELHLFLAPDAPSWRRTAELLGPYRRLHVPRVVFAPPSLTGKRPQERFPGVTFFPLPEAWGVRSWFSAMAAVQLFAFHLARALGRDVNRWVGGVRTELMESLGLDLVRGSRILPRDEGEGA